MGALPSNLSGRPTRPSVKRLAKTDWIELALKVLTTDGPEALTVASLCKKAQRTRGSLYHHFTDHDALLDAVVNAWAQGSTHALVQQTPPGPGASKRLQVLTMKIDPRLEQAIRRLVERVPRLRSSITQVDRGRVNHLAALHRAEGQDTSDARAQAEIEYAAFLGFQQLQLAPGRQAKLYEWFSGRLGLS